MKQLLLIGAVVLTAAEVRAAGFATVEPSATAMAAGGTGTARSDDPAASVYNPAALGPRRGLHLAIGAVLAAPSLEAKGDQWQASTEAGVSVPPHAHVAWVGDTLSAGLSFTIPFGSNVSWPVDWERRFDLQRASFSVMRLSAFGGYRWGAITVAAGPFVDFGSLELSRAIDFVDAEGHTMISTRATGMGGHGGVFVQASDALDLGFAYRSRSKLNLAGYADFDVPDEFSGAAADQAVRAEMLLPDRFAVGAVWRVREDLALAADLEVVLWSTIQQLTLDFANESTTDVEQPRNWRSTLVARIGATWSAMDWLSVHGGAFMDPSPTPKETVGPSSPDSTRLGLTAGAGVRLPANFELTLAYQRLQFLGATGTDDRGEVAYKGSANLFGAGLTLSL